MDPDLRDSMLASYNERAADYEEAYSRGTGTASITGGSVFTTEIRALENVIRGFGISSIRDAALDTGCHTTSGISPAHLVRPVGADVSGM